jgi:hypothetical protein
VHVVTTVDTRTANREASQVGLGVIEERICALARYDAELGIEPASKVEAKPQDFETQVRAVRGEFFQVSFACEPPIFK